MSKKKTNKIEAETGEVIQSNKPFTIKRGGIAKPIGKGLYLLQGKKHEQGGIDIDFQGDARVFSAQSILNGVSPAEAVIEGVNPNKVFNAQEMFKDVNGINDDGTMKAKCGKRIKAETGTETKQEAPTREEYITTKIDSTINAALNKSRTRLEPAVPIVQMSDRDKYDSWLFLEAKKALINKYSLDAARAANNGDYESYYRLMNMAAEKSRSLKVHQALHDKGMCNGNSCIYTATDNYGKQYRVSGNKTFAENPNKYGFIKINTEDRKPGDLQQVIDMYNEEPVHMMIFNGINSEENPTYNYSDGGHNKNSIKKNAKYPINNNRRIDTYRFVGTPADSVKWTNEYNKLYMNNSNKKQLGGSTRLIRVQANGKDRLMFIPSMGDGVKADKKKALFGTRLTDNGVDELSRLTGKTKDELIKEGLIKAPGLPKDIIGDVIGAGTNIAGTWISNAINKKMLGDLKYSPQPVAKIANKLVTRFDNSAEIRDINDTLAADKEAISQNISSSRVAANMAQAAEMKALKNKIASNVNRANREISLINADRTNQQNVSNANIDAYNAWNTGKIDFENAIREKQSENIIASITGTANTIQNTLTNRQKRETERNNLIAIAAANPNVNPEYLRALGATWVTDEMIKNWKLANGIV